jgi:flagellar FliL protein
MAAKKKQADLEEDENQTEEAADDGAEKPKRKLPSLKLMIIAAAGVLVLGGGGTAAYFMLGGKKDAAPAVAQVKPAVFLDMPEVLVNLSGTGDRTHYLKVKIVLELADASLTPQIQSTMPRVMDAFQTYLRELRPADLEGSAGLYRLKEELTRRVNATISPNRVNAVLFKEIVVQ